MMEEQLIKKKWLGFYLPPNHSLEVNSAQTEISVIWVNCIQTKWQKKQANSYHLKLHSLQELLRVPSDLCYTD